MPHNGFDDIAGAAVVQAVAAAGVLRVQTAAPTAAPDGIPINGDNEPMSGLAQSLIFKAAVTKTVLR